MDECIFCKIVSGDIPAYKVYEDEKYLAFLDIFPLSEGHTMVIPKEHARWVWDVENPGEYFEVISKIANHYREVFNEQPIVSLTIGEEVPHAHYHLIPPGDLLDQTLKVYSQKNNLKLDEEHAVELVKKLKLS